MRDFTTCPEAQGPLSESDLENGMAADAPSSAPSRTISNPNPPVDPAAEAIRRCQEAERAADLGKTLPPNATVVS